MKKILTLAAALSLIATLAVGGSIAYLQDTDEAVNVMTLGSVYIEQIEQQRDENGNLVDFKQDKPAYPAVGVADLNVNTESVNVNGTPYNVFSSDLKNVVDKIITVKNTGKSDAFVRTIIALEAPDYDAKNLIHLNTNSDVSDVEHPSWAPVDIDGIQYVYSVFTYKKALKPNDISVPSLMQVFLDAKTTNDDVAKFGSTWEILAVSQAVQTAGFDTAQAALDTAFGPADAVNVAKWMAGLNNVDQDTGDRNDPHVEYNGTKYENIYAAIAAANTNGGGEIVLLGSFTMDKAAEISSNITIKGNGKQIITRKDGYTGTMFTVIAGATLNANGMILDGQGATATGNLIATAGNGSIVLDEGTILRNNNGAHAVSLATRGGGTLTLNDAQIVNNSSDSGAIWGGGHIIMNEGSKISNNSSTGIGGAIRMVSSCNLTMNGGEISNNTAAGDGGAIWGYGSSTYNFNGGKMSGNTSAGTGGAIYIGTYSVINISGDFELCDNTAANSGAIRLTDHTSMTMTGGKVSGNKQNGESNAFNTWNNSISITGGELADNMSFVGGLGLTIGAADIDGVIHYNLSTNHNTAYLAKDFNGFKFTVNETNANFANFNFKPAADYTYADGDEAKLVCMNNGYETYWDASTGTFRLKAK